MPAKKLRDLTAEQRAKLHYQADEVSVFFTCTDREMQEIALDLPKYLFRPAVCESGRESKRSDGAGWQHAW